jgi:hypothetical protein
MSKPIGSEMPQYLAIMQPYCVANLKYSVWRTGTEVDVCFMNRIDGILQAYVFNVPKDPTEERKCISTVGESKIFHSGWVRSDCVSAMPVSVKDAFVKNLVKMKIANIDTDKNIYVCDRLW